MKRRNFIKTTAGAVPLLSLFPADLAGMIRENPPGKIERRSLGKTGEKLSMLGFGGIVVMDATPQQASSRVSEAIDYGINYFDVAPSYGDAEIKLGPALQPYRKDVFLACKTTERSKDGARKELEQSLKRLKTDHLDLYQLHAVTTLDDVKQIFAPGGAMETFLAARNEGKVRFLGFSAHSVEAANALMDQHDFDTILFPVNYTTWYAGNFGPQVLERAHSKQMGILALKAMAKSPYPEGTTNKVPKCWYQPLTDPEEALMGLRFTLSHPVTAALPPGNEDLFKMALELSSRIKPLSAEEIKMMKEKGKAGTPIFQYPMA
ncbi:aldo/keto reductase [Prolixibacter sp. NT017]|uniref:aldo/keto reductase n=1 Tax=Prolixibacter sp. NT017 TaxID=2652390 RepID=UPI001298F829|nr:aldo/keto reductase [Prolixibacter sp. NT017]